jgi:hypothetical protein
MSGRTSALMDDYQPAIDLVDRGRRWLDETANVRVHGTTGQRPCDRLPDEGLRAVVGAVPTGRWCWSGGGWRGTAS